MGQDKILVCPDSAYVEDGVLYLDTDWDGVVPDLGLNAIRFYADGAFTLETQSKYKSWNGTLYYSANIEEGWQVWDGTTVLESGDTHELFMRGVNNTVITGDSNNYRWVFATPSGTSDIWCEGDIASLLDYRREEKGLSAKMESYAFANWLNNNNLLKSAPSLSPKTLAPYCYMNMFSACARLQEAPELPATRLETGCYFSMFSSTGIITPPALPATYLKHRCYTSMFAHCLSLESTPELPSTNPGTAYEEMFYACRSITCADDITIVVPKSDSVCTITLDNMFYGCTGLTEAPQITVRQLGEELRESSYILKCKNMFRGCTGISRAKAPIFLDGASEINLENMYYDCTGIESSSDIYIPEHVTKIKLSSMFRGCTSLLESPYISVLGKWSNSIQYDFDSMFSKCTGMVSASTIRTQTPVNMSYMFSECTSLETPPTMERIDTRMPNVGNANHMFYRCRNLKYAPSLYLEKSGGNYYWNMFSGCTNLERADRIQLVEYDRGYIGGGYVHIIRESCFLGMFESCTKLSTVNFVWPDIGLSPFVYIERTAFFYMFYLCSSLTTPISFPNNVMNSEGIEAFKMMYARCSSLTSAPRIRHNHTKTSCFEEMFYLCINLESIPNIPVISASKAAKDMFKGCSKIKISQSQDSEYSNAFSITVSSPSSYPDALTDMFADTGGTFTGTPTANMTYYTSNQIVS